MLAHGLPPPPNQLPSAHQQMVYNGNVHNMGGHANGGLPPPLADQARDEHTDDGAFVADMCRLPLMDEDSVLANLVRGYQSNTPQIYVRIECRAAAVLLCRQLFGSNFPARAPPRYLRCSLLTLCTVVDWSNSHCHESVSRVADLHRRADCSLQV